MAEPLKESQTLEYSLPQGYRYRRAIATAALSPLGMGVSTTVFSLKPMALIGEFES